MSHISFIKAEKIIKALANRRRLAILKYLQQVKKDSVSAIADELKLSLKATSKHLAVLRSADIVGNRQVRLERHYFLNSTLPPFVKHILSQL